MELHELLSKLDQIEEHAKLTLDEYPNLTKERQRMIIALARFIKSEATSPLFDAIPELQPTDKPQR